MMAQEDPDHLRFLGRHFVALTCRIKREGAADEGTYFAASGFIISVHQVWFLITAGHIFTEIEQAKQQGTQFTNWHLDDTFALPKKRSVFVDGPRAPETIPFDLDAQAKAFYFDEDEGTDYAFIHVPPYYERLLRANGVTPFEEEHWTVDEGLRPADRVELVGIPADQITELSTPGLVKKTLVALPLHRTDDSDETAKYPHLLHAHVPDISGSGLQGFEHIRGMSGGPIIGFWKQPDGSETLRILAIQSRWNRSTKTIIAHPAPAVAEHLKNFLEAVLAHWLEQEKDRASQ
jgi:hypothetical protein